MWLQILLSSALLATRNSADAFKLLPHEGPLPIPTKEQLEYQGGISGLITFGMATFFHEGDPGCDAKNWNGCETNDGLTTCNSSKVSSFNPTNLNVSAWVASFKDLGATSVILTAKHGCGFLGWKTNTTLPDGTPYRYHVPDHLPVLERFVAETSAAGIGHGFYYSLKNNFFLNVQDFVIGSPSTALPGQVAVTKDQFEALALAQVAELWTKFGDLTEIWLDGGCGYMCDNMAKLLRKTNKNGVAAFNGGNYSLSPIRWALTESGSPVKGPGGAIWSTADFHSCAFGSGPGSPPNSTAVRYCPIGVDVTLQAPDVWFFKPGGPIKSIEEMAVIYHNSVGANGHLEVDFAIDRTGGIAPKHAKAYLMFGNWIRSCYGKPVAEGSLPTGKTSFVLSLPSGAGEIDRIRMEEDQAAGQRIMEYKVEAMVNGAWQPFTSGVSVGAKRIDVAASAVEATSLRFTVVSGFDFPTGLKLFAFTPGPCDTTPFQYPT